MDYSSLESNPSIVSSSYLFKHIPPFPIKNYDTDTLDTHTHTHKLTLTLSHTLSHTHTHKSGDVGAGGSSEAGEVLLELQGLLHTGGAVQWLAVARVGFHSEEAVNLSLDSRAPLGLQGRHEPNKRFT